MHSCQDSKLTQEHKFSLYRGHTSDKGKIAKNGRHFMNEYEPEIRHTRPLVRFLRKQEFHQLLLKVASRTVQ